MRQLQLEELGRVHAEAYKTLPKIPLIVALDNIRSGHNVGSVFRTADGFLVQEVILGGYTPCPPDPEIQKTALGANEVVNWQYCSNFLEKLQQLKQEGYILVAAEQTDNSISLMSFEAQKDAKYVLIMGNEVRGVSPEVLALCDFALEIPQQGTKHSLNVSVAAGILMWSFYSDFTS